MPLQIIRQDITKMQVDAIVNTTNEEMVGYSGVDYAVHQGAGPELDKECQRIAPLKLGTAKITKGYNLDAKYIIHTAGPIWQGGNDGESDALKSCYLESLKLAVQSGCESVASKTDRDKILAELKKEFTVRHLQRITGISRGVITKA